MVTMNDEIYALNLVKQRLGDIEIRSKHAQEVVVINNTIDAVINSLQNKEAQLNAPVNAPAENSDKPEE